MIDLAFCIDLVLAVILTVIVLVICAGVAAFGWCIVRGILQGVQQSKEGDGKDGREG